MRRVCFPFASKKKAISPQLLTVIQRNYAKKLPKELGGIGDNRFINMPEINMPIPERQKRFSEIVEEMKVIEQNRRREPNNVGDEFKGVRRSDQAVRGPRQKRKLGEKYKVIC